MPRQISEERTRKEMKIPLFFGGVDLQLEQAGWHMCTVQSVFLQKRHLETADASTGSARRLYEPPLDMFGADAVERWFTQNEMDEFVKFTERLAV